LTRQHEIPVLPAP